MTRNKDFEKLNQKKINKIPSKALLEYQVNIVFDPRDKIFVARAPELENCHTHGRTPEEAISNAQEAIKLWIETAKEKKIPIPPPTNRRQFSGKFILRASSELHATLAKEAIRRGKSMNDLVVSLLKNSLAKT